MSRIVDITVAPVVTAGAYSAKDVVGGLLTFANAASVYRGSGIIRKIVIKNNAGVADLLMVSLFNEAPAVIADNGPFDPTDAEMADCIGIIPIVAADYVIATDNAIATKLRRAAVLAGELAARPCSSTSRRWQRRPMQR